MIKSTNQLGHLQAMRSAGHLIKVTKKLKGTALSEDLAEQILELVEFTPVEKLDYREINQLRLQLMTMSDDFLTDYYESVLTIQEITLFLRLIRYTYDILNGLELMTN